MTQIIVFLVIIGILIIVHEFGHYLFARLFKVKVLTFSVGFGPKLFKFKAKSNEWCIAAIPLGGYVRMLDEREASVPEDERHLAFNNKPAYAKILIAVAGPLFNILFALFAYYYLALNGVNNLQPIVSSIDPKTAVLNGINIKPSQTIDTINGVKVNSWSDADTKFNRAAKEAKTITLKLSDGTTSETVSLSVAELKQHTSGELYLETIGLYPIKYLPVISYLEPDSPAFKAGLKINDKIFQINDIAVTDWFELSNIIKASPNKRLEFKVIRGNSRLTITLYAKAIDSNGQVIGKIGIMPTLDQKLFASNSFTQKYNMMNAFSYALTACYNMLALNLSGLFGIISGKISLHNIGGPFTIAKAGANALNLGLKPFIDFLALISISLAIMNLLPIPVLDGGHIVIYTLEWLRGKAISATMQLRIFKFGFIFIIALSMIAIYNDILRW